MDKDLLISRLEMVSAQLDTMHEMLVHDAATLRVAPRELRTTTGELRLVPIFVAQANVLSALAYLEKH